MRFDYLARRKERVVPVTFIAVRRTAVLRTCARSCCRGSDTALAIHAVFIFRQSGEMLISHTSPLVHLDSDLLSGLFAAIRDFVLHTLGREMRDFKAGDYWYHYDVHQNLIALGLTDDTDDKLQVEALLHGLNVLFFEKFERVLRKWDHSTDAFRVFTPTIDEALRAYHEASEDARSRMTSIEWLLTTFGKTLDPVLLGVLAGNALIVRGNQEKIEQLSRALKQTLRYSVPNMPNITDVQMAQGILDSLKQQRDYQATLLGVSEKVYHALTTLEHLAHHVFISLEPDPPACLTPPDQPTLDIAGLVRSSASDLSAQARLLDFQLTLLREQLHTLVQLRKDQPNLSPEQQRDILHFDAERFHLLSYLTDRSAFETG